MIRLYITSIDEINLCRVGEIDAQRAEKAGRLRFDDDKKRCIAGGLFIKRFFGDTEITYGKFGKPEAANGMYFNLSHSGEYVLFALSDSEIGCDIEKIKAVAVERLGRIVFCDSEMSSIKSADDKLKNFFRLWTRKESLLKCIGEGFHRQSKSVDISGDTFTENGITYHFASREYGMYIISVCSAQADIPITIKYIRL